MTANAAGRQGAPRRRGGAAAVAAGIFASRISGLVRTAVISSVFGVGPYADALVTALRAPNLLQNLLGEQALSASFIPVYARLLAAGRREEARRFAGAVFGLLLAVVAGLALLGVLAARPLVALFAGGYLQDAARVAAGSLAVDRFELAVRAVRWTFPMTGFLVLSAWALGVLNSHRRFFLSYVAPVVWNAAIVAALAWGILVAGFSGADRSERLLIAACVGALVGGLAQFLVQLPATLKELGGLRISFSTAVEGVQPALRAFWPALAGRGVVQLSSLLDQVLSTLLAVGAVSALSYAQVLYLLPVSLFGQSIAAAALPDLSAAGEGATRDAIAARARRALGRTGFLNLPVAVAYVCLGPILMGAVYRVLPGGRFSAADAWLVGMVLGAYALGLPASTGSRVLQSTFFAMGDTRTPARVAAGRMVVGIAVALPTMIVLDRVRLIDVPGLGGLGGALRLGAIGLAFGASVAAWFEWGLLSRSLATRLSGFRWPAAEALRVLAASLAGAAAGLGAARFLAARLAPLPLALVTAASFGAAFLAVGMASGLPELERVMASMRRSRS